ncbi:MAG TPA: branched-chain-amino-acid transaminase [bacterium]|nr:branched-chain-amino-acid transaminase [bacterium]
MGMVYVNGRFVSKEEASVSVYDHGFLYGDGIFEGIRCYNGRVFKLTEHVDRLFESALTMRLEIPISRAEFAGAIVETVRRTGLRDAYIRPVVSRGPGDLGIDPRKCPKANVVIIVDTIQLYPEEAYRKGLRLVTTSTRQRPVDVLNPRIKTCNYLNNIMARLEANLVGADEGLMLTTEGYVAECTADNIFLVRKGRVLTPPAYIGILQGVTRQTVLDLCVTLGVPAAEQVITLHDVYTADECFLTGTGAELGPVVQVDGRAIAGGKPGPVTNKILAAFRELAAREGTPVYETTGAASAGAGSD